MMVKSGLEKIFLQFLHALTMSFLLLNPTTNSQTLNLHKFFDQLDQVLQVLVVIVFFVKIDMVDYKISKN